MRKKIGIVLGSLAVVVGVAVTLTLTHSGSSVRHVTTASTLPTATGTKGAATAAPLQDPAKTSQELLNGITSSLQQAVSTNGGPPQTVSPDQIEAMLRQQLQQLGINLPSN